jgi:hypothetical protein
MPNTPTRKTASIPLTLALALSTGACAVEPDPTGTWVSAESETPRSLVLEDDRLRGSWGRESADGRHPAGSYDLARVGPNRYAGTARAAWQCWYYERGYRRENACEAEYPIELTVTDDDRIEGRLFMPGLDDRLNTEERARACDACDGNRESVWQGFLWVRTEEE